VSPRLTEIVLVLRSSSSSSIGSAVSEGLEGARAAELRMRLMGHMGPMRRRPGT
jgi:hypothetical protein